jgi:hypothetical protein
MQSITIEVAIPDDVQVFCELFSITPDELLTRFMNDLCSMQYNGGSDERRMAKEYFLRGDLASRLEPLWTHAMEVAFDFDDLYHAAYPASSNANWEYHRAELLKELRAEWMPILYPSKPQS